MAELNSFRVLSFDCYGTIIDWETGILSQLRPWVEGHGTQLGDREILESFGVAESIQEAMAPSSAYPLILRQVHKRLATQWGLPVDEQAADRFGACVGSWQPFPDSHDSLTRLKQRYRLVILSNVDRASFSASNRLLDVDFDAVYTAEDIGSYKPDPRNFAHLIEAEGGLGHRRDQILHVGQSLFHDHVPAVAAGLSTCWIQRASAAGDHGAARPPDRRPEVDFHFSSLAELADAAGV